MFLIINGLIEFVQGRTLAINGLKVDIPRDGCVFIGAELCLRNGRYMPMVRKLEGPTAERYGFMRIGPEQFDEIVKKIEERGGAGVDWGFTSPHGRNNVTVN